MTWMNKWSGGFPLYLDHARGNRISDVDGHTYVDFALGDTGAMAGHSPRATVEAVARRMGDLGGITTMLPTRGRPVGGRRADPPLRDAAVELHALGHRRQPLGGAPGPAGHRQAEDPGLRLLLPRLGRRDLRAPRPRRQGAVAPGQRRSPGAARPHHPGRDVERPGVGRARAGPRRRRRDPHRAGADQHRHRAARAGLHGGAARAGHPLRRAADDRRDAHLLGRLGRRDHRVGARAGHLRHRQVDRRRHPVGRLRHQRRRSPRRSPRHTDAGDADIVDVGGVGGTLAGNALSTAAMQATLRRGAHAGGVRAHDRARDGVHRGRAGHPRRARRAVVDPAAGRARRVPLHPARAAHRRGVGGWRTTTRSTPTCTSRCATAAS